MLIVGVSRGEKSNTVYVLSLTRIKKNQTKMSYTTDAWMHAFRSNAKQCIFGNDKRSELKYLQMGGAWTRANRVVPSPDPPYVDDGLEAYQRGLRD